MLAIRAYHHAFNDMDLATVSDCGTDQNGKEGDDLPLGGRDVGFVRIRRPSSLVAQAGETYHRATTHMFRT